MAPDTQSDGASAPQPTLLGLPAELRNDIYLFVAAGSTRPLLASRLMQLEEQTTTSPDNRNNVTPETVLNRAVGLHPLSRTCRQLRDEFQPVFLHESAPYHRLIINNFDVAQTEFVTSFLHKFHVRGFRLKGARRYKSHSGVPHSIKVEFLADSDIVKSADAFLQHVLTKSEIPKHLLTRSAMQVIVNKTSRISLRNTSSELIVRRRTPDMSPEQAARAVTALQLDETGRIFRCIETMIHDVELFLAFDGLESWSEEAVKLIRHVWDNHLRRSATDDWEEKMALCARLRQSLCDPFNLMRLGE